MGIVRMLDPMIDQIDGRECRNNRIKYDELVRREQLLAEMIKENETKGTLNYNNELRAEVSVSVSLRDYLCYCVFRGTEKAQRIYYVKASDGCEISDVYLDKYEFDLNYYNELRERNNRTFPKLVEREKTFKLKRIPKEEVDEFDRLSFDVSNYEKDSNYCKFINIIKYKALFQAGYEDSGILIDMIDDIKKTKRGFERSRVRIK